jgi:hypothetical protein
MVFWCFPASLAMARDCSGTWLKTEPPLQRQETLTRRAGRPLFWWLNYAMLLLVVFNKTWNHTSVLILFGSLRQEKVGSCVAFVLEPRRKADKQKLAFSFATQTLVISFTSFASLKLQHQIDAPWQMTTFYTYRNNGNSIVTALW